MKILLFGMLIISSVYSQCIETNWQEFFPYLMGCSLSGVDFSAELEQTGAYCGMINFSNANLSEASFSGENCYGAIFTEANLSGAQSGDANMDGSLDVVDIVIFINSILNGE